MTERDIFLAALEITDSTARKAYLDMACGENAVLRAAVESLFASHEGAGSFLNTPVAQTPGTTSSADTKADDPEGSSSAAVERTVHFAPGQAANMDDDDDGNTAEEIPLGYLSPSKKPDSLGRLGHYEVLQVLGKGAFGTVLKAFDEKLHRMVAIKVMSIELASTSPARKRFLREARASAAIRHDNVVAIYAVEEQPIPYLVMEYIPGKTLSDALVGEGPLELNVSLRLGQQIASGLAAAHSQGLIHRDIKPANILLEEGIQWKVKITDFGLARAADDASVTQSGTIAGTPMFMSPEQAHSSNIDQRSDLFSFGSVMYQMVSGRPPFRASSTLAVLKRVTEDTPRPIQEIIPEVPDWLVTIISKLHEKKADDRYQTAQEVADLLARCQSELQHAGKVTCVPESIPRSRTRESSDERNVAVSLRRDEPSTAAHPSSGRPSPDLNTSPPAIAQPSTTLQGSSRRSETATLKRPLFLAAFLAVAAIIAVVVINRDKTNTDVAGGTPQPTDPASDISNSKSQISKASNWHGWPADAPPPAISPFNAEQAKQHQDAWAKYLNVPVEYTNSIGMKFRLIPPGEFIRGNTEAEIEAALNDLASANQRHELIDTLSPKHKVVLTQPFYVGIHEVTQGSFETIMQRNPSHFSLGGSGKDAVIGIDTTNYPVEQLSWNDAAEFCSKLSEFQQLKPVYFRAGEMVTMLDGNGYQLPSEAEWEFAALAGGPNRYATEEQLTGSMKSGWFNETSGGRTHVVGEITSNQFGLFDTFGNVFEYTNDRWTPDRYQQFNSVDAINPITSISDSPLSVVRGGSWTHGFAFAGSREGGGTTYTTGFRVALPTDTVRTALKLTGPAIPKSPAMELSNTAPASEKSDSQSQMPNADPDRALAEWVLSLPEPRHVIIEGHETPITRRGDLPAGLVRVTHIYGYNAAAVSDADLELIASAQGVSSVQLGSSNLPFPNITDQGLKSLAGSSFATTGKQLIVNGDLPNVTDEGYLAFNACQSMEDFQVHSQNFTDTALASIHLPAASSLSVGAMQKSATQFSPAGLEKISERLPKLKALGLTNMDMSAGGIALLLRLPLETLGLGDCKLSDSELKHLSDLQTLEVLFLGNPSGGVTDSGFEQLAKLPRLTQLIVTSPEIGDKALIAISSLSKLKLIRVESRNITDEGLEKIDQMLGLETLLVPGTRVSDGGLVLIAKLPRLKQINLFNCHDITDAGLATLASMSSLNEIEIRGNPQLTEPAVRKLQAALPNCKIVSDYPDVAAMPAPSGMPVVDYVAERKAAEWVLSVGGVLEILSVDDQGLALNDGKLPSQPFWIRAVALNGVDVADDGLAFLNVCRRLGSLSLQGTPKVTSRGVNSLTDVPSLERLQLLTNDVDAATLDLGLWPKLKLLDVSYVRNSEAVLSKLQVLQQLEEFACGTGEGLTGAIATDVAGHEQLKRLYVMGDSLSPAGLADFVSKFPNLEHLQTFTQKPESLSSAVRAIPNLKSLICVDVAFSEAVVEALNKSPQFEKLELRVGANGLSLIQFELLAKLGEKLKRLEFECSPEGEKCFTPAAFERLQSLSNLEELHLLTGTGMSVDSGFATLTELAKLRRLEVSSIDGTMPDFESTFRKSRPDVELLLNGKHFPGVPRP